LHVVNYGSRICDLILDPADIWVHRAVRLEEAARRLHAMKNEHQEAVVKLKALQNSTTRVWDMVLKRV
jgi:hypothetical protein